MRTLLGLILGFGLQFGWVETYAQTPATPGFGDRGLLSGHLA